MRKPGTMALACLILLAVPGVSALSVSVKDSCSPTEEPLVSINSTSGGHLGEPGHYRNQLCVEDAENFVIRQGCKTGENRLFSLFSRTNSHFSNYTVYNYDVCSENVKSEIRSSCLGNQTAAFTVKQFNNSHAGSATHFGEKLCLYREQPENVTLELSGLSGSFYSDDTTISSGESRTLASFPYIVRESSGNVAGIVSYGEFVKTSRTSTDTVSLTQSESSFLLPYTSGGHEDIEDDQDRIVGRNFLDLLSPSFSYPIPEQPTVKVSLQPEHNVTGFQDTLNSDIEIEVANTGLRGDDLFVDFSPS